MYNDQIIEMNCKMTMNVMTHETLDTTRVSHSKHSIADNMEPLFFYFCDQHQFLMFH